MLEISVTADIKEAFRYLRKVGERNIPLAVAQALTGTAKHLAKVQARSTARHFDRPTKFTQRGFGVRMAKASDYKRGTMFSRVFAKDIQAGYLKFGVEGGRRTPKARAIVVPGPDAKLNRYGNFTRNYIKTQLAKPDTFSGTIGGVAGIWQRSKRGENKLLAVYKPGIEYDRRYPYHQISARIVPREVTKQLNRSIRRAAKARA
jgi:hypothetical protein